MRNTLLFILLGFASTFWAIVFSPSSQGQVSSQVDFARDVQPLFKQYCIGCHGPSQQMNGLRLDQRSSALKTGARRLVPGSSENSLVYLKLIGGEYGLQMPPTGPLRPEQIRIIKDWIDQGAGWPDDLAGGAPPPPPPDPNATRIMDALRNGDRQAFKKVLSESPRVINLKGPGGSTPLMYAALYGDADDVRVLLDIGFELRNATKRWGDYAESSLSAARVESRHVCFSRRPTREKSRSL